MIVLHGLKEFFVVFLGFFDILHGKAFLAMDQVFFHDALEFFVESDPLRILFITLIFNATCNSTFPIFQVISC